MLSGRCYSLLIVVAMVFTVLPLHSYAAVRGAATLPAYNVDPNETSVSGLSSGGFFAVQMHVAFSSIVKGAGVFAGGPYDCAQGSVTKATTQCMSARTPPDITPFVKTTDSRSSSGQIDDTSNLTNTRAYLFSGTQDTTVHQPVMDALNQYYQHYIPASNVQYINNVAAAHTQPTDDPINTNKCTVSASPYISYCNYDGAGMALNHIYGNLTARNNGPLSGSLMQFDQTEFVASNKGMATTGWIYVPSSCASNSTCKLHISFHGCMQNYASVGNAYINNTGYNKWADTNNMIVLYPQTVATEFSPSNPNGCWDWWGYDNDQSTYDTKSGYQMAAIKKMIDRISSGFTTVVSPTGLTVVSTTNSTVTLKWDPSPAGSGVLGFNVYRDGVLVNAEPLSSPDFTDENLLSGSQYTYNVRAVGSGGTVSAPSSSVTATTTGPPPPLAAPQSLAVTSVTATSITISWQPVAGASSYNVYRNGNQANQQSVVTPSFTDSGLAANTTYQYVVRAVNSNGLGPASVSLAATTASSWSCTTFTASNYAHVQAGRAYAKAGFVYAKGSNQNMGLDNIFVYTTLAETGPDYYVIGTCSSYYMSMQSSSLTKPTVPLRDNQRLRRAVRIA